MEPLFILFVVAIVAIAIPVAIYSSKKANEAWAGAARQLKMQFTPASLGVKRRIAGRHQGMRVEVDTYTQRHGKHSTTYTRFTVSYPESLGLGLRLSSEGFFSGIKKVFGAQDIEVGDSSFDDAVIIKGSNPQRVIDFLTRARRIRIGRFLASHQGAVISDTKVQWKRRGLVRDTSSLVSRVNRVVDLAHCLVEEREEDHHMERVLEAQHVGRLDEALMLLTGTPLISLPIPPAEAAEIERTGSGDEVTPPRMDGVEEKILEGELLYLGDRNEEAKEAFAGALARDPEDEEAREWLTRLSVDPEPSAPPPVLEAVAESPPELDLAEVCALLFTEGVSSFEVSCRFEKDFQGKAVRGSGVLTEAVAYAYDFVFDDRDGTKVTLSMGETDTGAYGRKEIFAILRLPAGAAGELNSRIGETVTFRGKLKKADGFMRNVFVAEGSLE